MAERQSAKRDHPEGGKTSEAEAKPQHSTATSTSKRIRMEDEEQESPVVDSTTVGAHNEEVFPSGDSRFEESVSKVDESNAAFSTTSWECTHKGGDSPSSSSGNNLQTAKTKTGSLLEGSVSTAPSDCQLSRQSDRACDSSEAVSGLSVDGDPVGILYSGSDQKATARAAGRSTGLAESPRSSESCDSQSELQNITPAADTREDLGHKLEDNLAIITSDKPEAQHASRDNAELCLESSGEGEAHGASSDAQGGACVGGEQAQGGAETKGEPLIGLKEVDVGIVEYISKHRGFHGVIKQRYQDFLVNEVDAAGNIVRLTDLSCPDTKKENLVKIDEVLSAHDKQRLQEVAAATDKNAFHCIEVQDLDKDQRKRVHEVIRQDFGNLESCTLDGGGKKVIKVTKVARGGRKQRSNWDRNRPNFCRFVMHKENMEVNDALSLISKYSHVKHQSFGFSGTKDKRAITVQEVTVYRVEAERLSRLNSILRGIRLGNFRYVKEPLTLGDHSGNHFVIVLRDVEASKEEIDHALSSMRDVGFINYYGMQRFGNSQIATNLVGRAILHSNWQEAVDLILRPREGNSQDNRWRQHWLDTRDPRAVMDILPKHKTISIEMQLLKGLQESKNNYLRSLQCLPRNVKLLYVHSYQSYVWNVLTTRRIQKYGLKVIPGDLVLKDSKSGDKSEDTEHLQASVVDDSHLDRYSIHDVVLPLPGYAVQYPQNEVGDWYSEMLRSDGLDIKNMRHQVKDYSLSGTYRKMVVKPENVSWDVLPYSDVTLPLVQSDLDRLDGKAPPAVESDGNLRALRLEFTLSSCCYATMAIREVLKIDTSAAHQSSLNPLQQTEVNNSPADQAEATEESI